MNDLGANVYCHK